MRAGRGRGRGGASACKFIRWGSILGDLGRALPPTGWQVRRTRVGRRACQRRRDALSGGVRDKDSLAPVRRSENGAGGVAAPCRLDKGAWRLRRGAVVDCSVYCGVGPLNRRVMWPAEEVAGSTWRMPERAVPILLRCAVGESSAMSPSCECIEDLPRASCPHSYTTARPHLHRVAPVPYRLSLASGART